MNINVIVFDDSSHRRDGLELLINSSEGMKCVATFADGRNALNHVERFSPDVILMDIDMPHTDGIESVKEIRSKNKEVKILMQTVFEDNKKIIEAICAGADGYILKQKSPLSLLSGIEEVMKGGAPMSPTIARKVLTLFHQNQKAEKKIDFDLTQREKQILDLLVQGNSYKMIADMCHISHATVNTHISHIYKKLQVNSVAGAVSKAIKEGIV